MELIDSITVLHRDQKRVVELLVGDLTQLPAEHAVDVLVVSAFPDDYVPTSTSLIGALHRRGVSIAALATKKECDLRQFSSCWLSRIIDLPGIHVRRILCFEPLTRGRATEVVGDIFRSIIPFTTGQPPISQIALPLVATGAQGEPAAAMLEALLDASVHWLTAGMSLEKIKIVLSNSSDLPGLRDSFARVKRRLTQMAPTQPSSSFRFDVFISYSQQNKEPIDALVSSLRTGRSDLRVFMDRLELRPGAAWQQHIFEALDASRRVICAFSPEYLSSKICNEEFNIAMYRHRESTDGVLLPLYLFTTELPTYMKLVHYADVREGDSTKIAQAAKALLDQI